MSLKSRLKRSLKTIPFHFQMDGIRFIKKGSGRVIVGDDMGVGKTLQVLGWLSVNPSKRPVVIVTPANAKFNWSDQIEKHTFLSCDVLSGRKTHPITEDIVVINYDIISYWQKRLIQLKPAVLVLDECHYLKNRKAQRTETCRSLSRVVKCVLPLSGTPIINRPVEFFPVLNMIQPKEFPNFWKFAFRYCGAKRGFRGWEFKGASHLDELRERILPFFLRRMKSEVLKELPEKRRTILPVEINNKNEYKKATLNFLNWYKDKAGTGAVKRARKAQAIVKLGQLKQLTAEGKLKQAFEWIDDFLFSTDEKLVVFVYHKSIFGGLSKQYKKISAVGGKSGKERQRQVEKFQTDPKCRLFIGSLAADKEAITLTASSTVFFLELGWTPAEHEQAEDRVNRIGQTDNKITVYYMIGRNTIDEYVWEIIEKKRKIINKIMTGKSHSDGGIDISNLISLLKGKKNGKGKKRNTHEKSGR